MFEYLKYIKNKIRAWQKEKRWVPVDICSINSMTIYMFALNPNESPTMPIVLNKDDGVKGGKLTIDTTDLAKTIGEEKALRRAAIFMESLIPQFEEQNLICLHPYKDKDAPQLLHLPMTNRRYTTREKTLNRMKRVVYPHIANTEQKAAGEESKWDEKKEEYMDNYHADLLNRHRKTFSGQALDDLLEREMRLAEQDYDRQHPNDGRAR